MSSYLRVFVFALDVMIFVWLIFGGCELQARGLMKVDENMLVDAH